MRYKSFRIRNFKGIKDTTVSFETVAGANVFAFVGLNESGKTTILEAIHSFSPDHATSELLGGDDEISVPVRDRVPRHMLSQFTGDVSVRAYLQVTPSDIEAIAKKLELDHEIIIDRSSLGGDLSLERVQRFERGDFKKRYFTLHAKPHIKTGKQKKWRKPTTEENITIRNAVYSFTPDIAYFPTFVFDFPERIYLTDRGGVVDQFYRAVFQDILDFDKNGQTIEQDIIRRIRREKMVVPWINFLPLWATADDRDKIQHVMDRASAAVTKLVFGRWNRIFNEDVRGKEVMISFEVVEGEKANEKGVLLKTEEHDVAIQFKIKDGIRRFNVNDRSLGFRWFFSFMLFTQFRVSRSTSRPLLFLFDEPASNLHAAAQQKLIESFPEVARGEHVLAYTTHSHYMIEPKWLEQTFIVTNRSDDPTSSIADEISLDDESLDIRATTYRSFVNDNPSQTSYFQPILDRLAVTPSRFDYRSNSVVVEGKSDYYIIRYAKELFGGGELSIIPGVGAGTFGALAALHAGWNLNFLFLLDGDKQGRLEKLRYSEELGVTPERLVTIGELVDGAIAIEDLLDDEALHIVQKSMAIIDSPSKAQIRRFFQERLASGEILDLGLEFKRRSASLLDGVRRQFPDS